METEWESFCPERLNDNKRMNHCNNDECFNNA